MTRLYLRAGLGLGGLMLVMFLVLFLSAGTVAWWQAWLYWGVFLLSTLAITIYFLWTDPSLIERRVSAGPIAEPTAKQGLIQSFASLFFIAVLVVPGLDQRFGWSRVPLGVSAAADVLVVVAFYIVFTVFKENRFASGLVTTEKDQPVISSGPYRVIRHPMYSGGLMLVAVTPLALGSWWALVPAILLAVVIVIRLLDEERLLRAELPGYAEYCEKVRHRLIPGIW